MPGVVRCEERLSIRPTDNSSTSKAQFEKYRYILDGQGGVEKIIRALAHLRDSYPRKKKLATQPGLFPPPPPPDALCRSASAEPPHWLRCGGGRL
ncbi:MAG: hypothetical protein MN733_07140 [Nitrososphaera sp.]|nr:hypothetical protein [Nitrososphaera sp.]